MATGPETKFSENHKVVLITGANSGIGAGTAIHLACLGYSLVLNDIDTSNMDSVTHQCRNKGLSSEQILIVAGDLTKEEDLQRLISAIIGRFHRLDVLVNNAGVARTGGLQTSTMEDYDHVMNTNIRAHVHVTKLCLPHLIETKGNIINVSSTNAYTSNDSLMFYGMSKAAMQQFTHSLAAEVAPLGVRVNSVNPGFIDTGILRKCGYSEEQYQQVVERKAATIPIGRVGQGEDVAKAIAFLISEDASFIVGSALIMDGGKLVVQSR